MGLVYSLEQYSSIDLNVVWREIDLTCCDLHWVN